MYAVDPRSAWLAVECPVYGTPRQVTIFRTSDAGRVWQSSVVTDPNVSGTTSFTLDFVNRTTGWLEGPQLLESHDSGAHWTAVRVGWPGPAFLLGFTSAARGYGGSLAADNAAGWCCYWSDFAGFPLVTDDGGASWSHRAAPIPAGYKDADIEFGAPGFSGTQDAAIPISGYVPNSPSTPRLCVTYHTRDGGAHWWYAQSTGQRVCATYFFNSRIGWGQGGPDGTMLYRTVDGGRRWVFLKQWQILRFGTFVADFVNPVDGVLLGTSGAHHHLLVTKNGGRTWQSIVPRLTSPRTRG